MKEWTPEKKQQLTIGLFGVVSLLIVLLAFLQMRNNLYAPFVIKNTNQSLSSSVLSADDTSRLKSQDTDKDGLTDYDELYIYRTSAYLNDSDGDGLDDKTEITGGTDPNCPKGKNCGLPLSTGGGNAVLPSATQGGDEGGSATDYARQAAVIRQLLIKTGLDQNLLKKFDDKSLVELYNESVGTSGVNPEILSQALVQTSKLTPEELKKAQQQITNARLTATQLEEFKKLPFVELKTKLKETGYFDNKTLDSITEDQLRVALDGLVTNVGQ